MKTDLSPERLKKDHQRLLKSKKLLKYLKEKRCFTPEAIKNHQIGLTTVGNHDWLSFPVIDRKGKCHALKLKRLPDGPDTQPKSKFYPKGAKSSLYPLHLFDQKAEVVYITAGEPDTVVARALGLNSICNTAGEGTFDEKCLDFLRKGRKKKQVTLLFDNDDTGRKATEHVATLIADICPDWEIYSVQWSEDFLEKGDVTDFIREYDGDDPKQALLDICFPYEPAKPQDRLLKELNEPQPTSVLPVQDFVGGVAYITVLLNRNGKSELFTVTSAPEIFPCTEKDYAQHGISPVRMPVGTATARWSQQDVLAFVNKEPTPPLFDTFKKIEDCFRSHTDLQDERYYTFIAVWTVGTYFYRLFPAYPYMHFTGMWGTGKTKILAIIALFAFNGELFTSDSSSASVTRLIHANGSTCCIDEAEKLTSKRDDANSTLLEILRIGYKRGVTVRRCEGQNTQFSVVEFDPFSPKALAGIANIEAALSSRCVRIETQRTANEEIANSRIDHEASSWAEVRGALYAAFLQNAHRINSLIDEIELGPLTSRSAELWLPILTITSLIDDSGELTAKMMSLAQDMEQERKEDEQDTAVHQILLCIYDLLGTKDEEFLAAETIFDRLSEDDECDWLTTFDGSRRRGKWLNKNLRMLGLWKGRAKLKSVGGIKRRGYDIKRTKVLDAARRYGVILPDCEDTPIGELTPTQIQAVFTDSVPTVTDA